MQLPQGAALSPDPIEAGEMMKLGMLSTCGEEFHFVLYLGCCFQLAEQCISC